MDTLKEYVTVKSLWYGISCFSLHPSKRLCFYLCVCLSVCLLAGLLKNWRSYFMKFYGMFGHNPGTNRLDFESN